MYTVKTLLRRLCLHACVLGSLQLGMSVAHAAPPVIRSELKVVAVAQQPFTYQIEAAPAALGYSVVPLPYWLQHDADRLSGTPQTPGKWTMQLTALNQHGSSAAVELTVEVRKPEPRLDGLVDPTPVVISRPD